MSFSCYVGSIFIAVALLMINKLMKWPSPEEYEQKGGLVMKERQAYKLQEEVQGMLRDSATKFPLELALNIDQSTIFAGRNQEKTNKFTTVTHNRPAVNKFLTALGNRDQPFTINHASRFNRQLVTGFLNRDQEVTEQIVAETYKRQVVDKLSNDTDHQKVVDEIERDVGDQQIINAKIGAVDDLRKIGSNIARNKRQADTDGDWAGDRTGARRAQIRRNDDNPATTRPIRDTKGNLRKRTRSITINPNILRAKSTMEMIKRSRLIAQYISTLPTQRWSTRTTINHFHHAQYVSKTSAAPTFGWYTLKHIRTDMPSAITDLNTHYSTDSNWKKVWKDWNDEKKPKKGKKNPHKS